MIASVISKSFLRVPKKVSFVSTDEIAMNSLASLLLEALTNALHSCTCIIHKKSKCGKKSQILPNSGIISLLPWQVHMKGVTGRYMWSCLMRIHTNLLP